jgi:TetR/AcrR family transcriptional regulator
VRLAVREGLADTGRALLEDERARTLTESTKTVIRAQHNGNVDAGLDPELVSLLVLFLTIGPIITPQLVRLLTDHAPDRRRVQGAEHGLHRRPRPPAGATPARRRPDADGSRK